MMKLSLSKEQKELVLCAFDYQMKQSKDVRALMEIAFEQGVKGKYHSFDAFLRELTLLTLDKG